MSNYKPSKYSVIHILLLLYLAGFSYWLENLVPKWLLRVSILFFGYLGVQSALLFSQVKPYIMLSYNEVTTGGSNWPLVVVLWSYVLLFFAACMLHKKVAFLAACQLKRRFGIIQAP
ncbi:MAG: hypothetical protein OEY52_16555 [Gammaproteobacteria bacterium]|nr:hypothetical protein [Gammaproteobacteria bacterium]